MRNYDIYMYAKYTVFDSFLHNLWTIQISDISIYLSFGTILAGQREVWGFMVLGASMVEERPTSGCRICRSNSAFPKKNTGRVDCWGRGFSRCLGKVCFLLVGNGTWEVTDSANQSVWKFPNKKIVKGLDTTKLFVGWKWFCRLVRHLSQRGQSLTFKLLFHGLKRPEKGKGWVFVCYFFLWVFDFLLVVFFLFSAWWRLWNFKAWFMVVQSLVRR